MIVSNFQIFKGLQKFLGVSLFGVSFWNKLCFFFGFIETAIFYNALIVSETIYDYLHFAKLCKKLLTL